MPDPARLISAMALAACAQSALADAPGAWQCATIGVGSTPAIAEAASDYLGRAGRIYPASLLGIVRSGDRIYLFNARDDGWSERVRLGLMELRLAEPDITAARRFYAETSGSAVVDDLEGDYVCLSHERAGHQGLALNGRGEVFLAPGKSVHLVDPREPAVAVEVRAVGGQPLDFREILALSGRSGIYAGLAGSRARQDTVRPAAAGSGEAIAVAIGPAGRPDGEVVITPRSSESRKADVRVADAAPAPRPEPSSVAESAAAAVIEAPPVRIVAEIPSVPKLVQPVAQERPVAVAAARISATQAGPSAGGSADDYSRAMKAMMELRRAGGVRSISEMTYVHPAVEYLTQ